jgi:hypothetical protein
VNKEHGKYRLFGRCDHCYDVVLDADAHEAMMAVLVHEKCLDMYLMHEQGRQDNRLKSSTGGNR